MKLSEAKLAANKSGSLKILVNKYFKSSVKEEEHGELLTCYYFKEEFIGDSDPDDGTVVGFAVSEEGQFFIRYKESIHSGSNFEFAEKDEIFNLPIYQVRRVN